MTVIEHPLFGTVDLATAGEWDAKLRFGGHEIDVTLTLDEPSSAPGEVEARLSLLDELTLRDREAREAMAGEATGGEDNASGLYIAHHRDELPQGEWEQLFGAIEPNDVDAECFLAQLQVVRVGLYPDAEDRCLLLDYTLPDGVTNYLLSVSFDHNGQLADIEMES